MMLKFEKQTDGVILICSKKGLKNYFSVNQFNYDFPEGILPLINKGIVMAVATESGEDVEGQIIISEAFKEADFKIATKTKFYIEEGDEIFVLSHSEFTQTCSSCNGDIDTFSFWNEKISLNGLTSGWYSGLIHFKLLDEMPYLNLVFQLMYSKTEPISEEVTNIIAL